MSNFDFDYKIIRNKGKGFRGRRKTLSIYVRNDDNASVEVRCGLDTPVSLIEDFLAQKSAWINRKRAQVLSELQSLHDLHGLGELQGLRKLHDFEENSAALSSCAPSLNSMQEFPLFGKLYVINFADTRQISFSNDHFEVPAYLKGDPEKLHLAFKKLYKKIARDFLSELVASTAQTMAVQPTGLRITSAHTRWGSCSGKNSLNFSYRLIFADPDCIRYVVVHELAHIKHHDHSARFWSLVASHCPDHRAHAARLKALARSPWFRIL